MIVRYLILLIFFSDLYSAQVQKLPETVLENSSEQTIIRTLKQKLNSKYIADSARINIFRKICREYIDTDNDELKKYATAMLRLSEKTSDQSGIADALNFLGIVEDIDAHYSSALKYYNKALPLAKSSKRSKLVASISNNIGLLQWKAGDYRDALSTFFSALKYAEATGSVKIQGNICSNIGLVYQEINQRNEALNWQKKALVLRKKDNNNYSLASNFNNLANAYSILGKHDSALLYQQKAISLQTKINDQYGLGISYLNSGAEYKKLKNYRKALWYYEKSKAIREQEQDSLGLSYTYLNIAECYKDMGNLNQAIPLAEKALMVSKNIKSDDRIAESSKSLAEIYRLSGNLSKAIILQQQYTAYQEKIFNTEMIDKAAFLNVKYETEKKEKELNLSKLKISQEVLSSRQKNIWLIVLAGLVIVGMLIFRNLNIKSRLRQKQLALENDLLQEQNISKAQQQRLEISRDLHDSVGSQLTLMSSTLDSLINISETDSSRYKEKISSLSTFVDLSISELRNTLWILNANEVFLEDLHLKILNFINNASEAKEDVKFNYKFVIHENVKLDSKVAANIFRILQEIINNSLKHSEAGLIDIQINQNLNDLKMIISDNGKGFDFEREKDSSFGLSNIHKRIDELSGTLKLETSPGKGTRYTIVTPLK
ncbi:tetratricopeptide repeat-containing sensor histidine kinase [Chryseobacterium caseinilyticum]|uniref:histidine kinase n=1 Tax=Chryseobacterium caseinilyticum TaxID=2771428 RepID=A0ABR8Z8K4_9FLAO|nr:sensor histidine kinase [Chryseobacterium caseinilyticum]MBD8081639.1 tetratricopeptide repeat protein [Chryseobacterium caseinilyticum]